MTVETFIDTNVLAYAFDSESVDKAAIAQRILAQAEFIISTQVLSELYVTLTRKLTKPVPSHVAQQVIDELRVLPVMSISHSLVASAIDTSIRHQLSYWDALIIETAAFAGCHTLLTEDLNTQAVISGVSIVNPFDLPE